MGNTPRSTKVQATPPVMGMIGGVAWYTEYAAAREKMQEKERVNL